MVGQEGAQLVEPRAGYLERLREAGRLAEDVEWWMAGPDDVFPWAGTFRSYDGIRRWHAALDRPRHPEMAVPATGGG